MTTEPWVPSAAARRLFDSAVVIDGLDTSSWGEEQVFRDLRDGGRDGRQRNRGDLGRVRGNP